ncbi:hypothetical protein C8R45DRAFT_944861 [Mycena sanguinolenta]|nr:hypothetical protein C8R45DRAFT_944861 [Mycena sanguinolenta]
MISALTLTTRSDALATAKILYVDLGAKREIHLIQAGTQTCTALGLCTRIRHLAPSQPRLAHHITAVHCFHVHTTPTATNTSTTKVAPVDVQALYAAAENTLASIESAFCELPTRGATYGKQPVKLVSKRDATRHGNLDISASLRSSAHTSHPYALISGERVAWRTGDDVQIPVRRKNTRPRLQVESASSFITDVIVSQKTRRNCSRSVLREFCRRRVQPHLMRKLPFAFSAVPRTASTFSLIRVRMPVQAVYEVAAHDKKLWAKTLIKKDSQLVEMKLSLRLKSKSTRKHALEFEPEINPDLNATIGLAYERYNGQDSSSSRALAHSGGPNHRHMRPSAIMPSAISLITLEPWEKKITGSLMARTAMEMRQPEASVSLFLAALLTREEKTSRTMVVFKSSD